ncbi:MAG: hypothetical protein ACLQBB_15965 [Solirubrobacteraceae bacterium]
MFVLTALVYPCVLALMCIGAGLFADRVGGLRLPGMLLAVVGAAVLIAASQLTTYFAWLAPATPYVVAALAIAGLALGRDRIVALAGDWRAHRYELAVGPIAFAIALAPVLAAGRPSFSSYQALTDSAVHMLGADYLMHHGQDYAHLDLRNSYGLYLQAFYGTGYPSGADTLLGASTFALGLPVIWTLQPFTAVMLALATGPAWVLARRMGLERPVAALAAVTATVPALVYGYALIASVKEIVALPMILAAGALVVSRERGRWRARDVIGLALVLAAGVSALGVGFGAWALATVAVLAVPAIQELVAGRVQAQRLLGLIALSGGIVFVAALGTWLDLGGSLHVTQAIATTANPGNLGAPLRKVQALGTWLSGSYEQAPSGGLLTLSYAIAALTLIAAVVGFLHLMRVGEHALAGWIACVLAVGVVISLTTTTWVDAKTIMLSSPVLVLTAWAGIAGLRALRGGPRARGAVPAAAVLVAVLLTAGIGVSDAMQYHASNLAPTQRYEELASINRRYAGRGPVLVDDFDEYDLYVLRDMDVGGLDFTHPPAGLTNIASGRGGHGSPVDLDRVPPAALKAYPVIVTRRDPTVSDPPSAYRLAWEGTYYQVWLRRKGAPAAIAHLGSSGARPLPCASIGALARLAGAHGGRLVVATPPELVSIDVARSRHPSWVYTHPGLEMTSAGRMEAEFSVPRAGSWEIWLKGEVMPSVQVSVDDRAVGSIGGQLDGNPHNPETTVPLPVRLSAGRHRLTIVRPARGLAPGEGGWSIVHEIFLTRSDTPDFDTLQTVAPARWHALCGRRYSWIEAVA